MKTTKTSIFLFLMALFPLFTSAQLRATIDSITYSNKVDIQQNPLEKIHYTGKPLPLMILSLSIFNQSEEQIIISNRNWPTIFFRYFYKAKPAYDGLYYYLPAKMLNKPSNEEDEFYESRVQIIHPGQNLPLKVWMRPSLKDMDINQEWGLISAEYSKEDLIHWFKDILRNFKVVIYYGFETGMPKILISDFFDKDHTNVKIDVF